jgi:hypothetical protein
MAGASASLPPTIAMPVVVGFSRPDTFLVHASGVVTYTEVQRSVDDLLAHPGLSDARKLLVDGHAVTAAPSSNELRAIVRDMKPLMDRDIRTMAIVTDRSFVYGVARMFGVFAEAFGMRVRAFRTIAEGEAWLRVTPAPVVHEP